MGFQTHPIDELVQQLSNHIYVLETTWKDEQFTGVPLATRRQRAATSRMKIDALIREYVERWERLDA